MFTLSATDFVVSFAVVILYFVFFNFFNLIFAPDQLINQSINQSISQLINETIKQSVYRKPLCS